MRLSEKTLEINICCQWPWAILLQHNKLPFPFPFWFGLTQRQEATAGFDVGIKHGARLLLFQFKASNTIPKKGTYKGQRKFTAQHLQLDALRRRTKSARSVFYVLPDIGTTKELQNGYLLDRTYLVDVQSIPPIPPPNKKSLVHNMYLDSQKSKVTICSEPKVVNAFRLSDIFEPGSLRSEIGFSVEEMSQDEFLDLCKLFTFPAMGLLFPR